MLRHLFFFFTISPPPSLTNTVKAVFRGISRAINAFVCNEERPSAGFSLQRGSVWESS